MIATFVLLLGYMSFKHMGISIENQLANSALDYAKTIASLDEVQQGLSKKVPYEEIQMVIEDYRKETRYQYIIVMDMEGIQYSYPYESGVGKRYKNGGEEKVLHEGIAEKSVDRNELISAVRAFAPVYYERNQVGAVLVGLLTDEVHQENRASRLNLELSLVIGLLAGILIAYLLSKNIKKSTFGLEPQEIGLLLTQRELILKSIGQGMIAVDRNGTILIMNEASKKILGLPDDAIGQSLGLYHPELLEYIHEIIESEKDSKQEEKLLTQDIRVLIRTCLMRDHNNQVVGAVTSLESFTHVRELAEQITDYQGMIDSLRAQGHEFMNKLHTVSGLIQLEAYEEALDYIDSLSSKGEELQYFMKKSIKDYKVAGLLLAKYNQLTEAKIDVHFLNESYVTGFPKGLESTTFCSILGNLLDNSWDALIDVKNPSIEILIQSDSNSCFLRIKNNGPMISDETAQHLYEKNYTTKPNGNGIGLYMIKKEIDALHGKIEFVNDGGVTWYVRIPS